MKLPFDFACLMRKGRGKPTMKVRSRLKLIRFLICSTWTAIETKKWFYIGQKIYTPAEA
jgi:hypothetical protein